MIPGRIPRPHVGGYIEPEFFDGLLVVQSGGARC